RAGVRLAPNAWVTFDGSAAEYLAEGRIGVGCYLSGCVHLGRATRVGSYVTLEDTILEGIVDIGTRARLAGVEAHNVTVHGADDPTPLGSPVRLLSALTEIVGCRLTDVVVSSGCSLRDVTAQSTLIPPHARIEGAHLGLRRDPGIGMPYRSVPPVHELVPTTYLPGAFRFGDKKGTFDWDGLCTHVLSMSRAELATRSASHLETRQLFCDCVEELLGARFGSAHLIDSLTPEELWGVIYELSAQVTGTDDPYRIEKLKSRALAADLLEKLKPRSMGWDVLLRVDIAANLIDFTSARVVSRLSENPSYLLEALQAASDATLAIDSRAEFYERLVDGAPQRVLWLTDNDGEVVFDLWIAGRLLDAGHHVTVAARSAPASNDATVSDVRRVMEFPLFLSVRTAEREGRFELIGSGSNTAGTNLFRATPQFMRALLEADVVVSKGQGNWYTLQGIRRDTFFMLMSKGLTAERTTGVIADPAALVDGMVLAFVPEDATWDRPLRDMVADASGA
ncbi:DUF89 family protein, partial [Candidatus Poribacteria bacterium]|nr:DUF89 family protein [Candidatus Poribacteria bacterium]